jgi:hypothetical protein
MNATNGVYGERVSVGKASKGRKPASRVRKAGKVRGGRDGLLWWAYGGVGGTLALSAWLNGLAFSGAAPWPVAGWVLGVTVPVLVLVFSRVAGLLWGRGRKGLALVGAGATLAVLALSVQHLASSIARLTGEGFGASLLLAVAVDVGLVVCELATVRK